MSRPGETDDYGSVVYLLFSLGAIFVGPLEAVLGLAAYGFLRDAGNGSAVSHDG